MALMARHSQEEARNVNEDVQRDLGRHDADIESLKAQVDRIETKVDSLVSAVDRAKGGWQLLLGVAGVSSAVTAVMVKLIAAIKGGT
jgi:chromosome segregation ATPase